MKTTLVIHALAAAFVLCEVASGEAIPPKFPGSGDDFFNLGPTGAEGTPVLKAEAEKAGLKKCNGLRIDKVNPGTPADGALFPGDLVWLAGGKPFGPKDDPVLVFSEAVEETEASKDGILKLKLLRAGKPADVQLTLKTLPPHSKGCPSGCPKCDAVVKAGLDVLRKLQAADGSLPAAVGGNNAKVVATSLAGLSWLASGSTPSEGPYKDAIRRAVAFVLREGGKEMKWPSEKGNMSQVNWNVGYAPIFLSEAYMVEAAEPLLKKVRELAAMICANQEASGGWAHGPGGPNALNYVELEIVSNYCLAGLGCARRIGVEVPQDVIDKAVKYVAATGGGDGGVGYSTRSGQQGHGDPGRTAGALLAFDALELSSHPFRPKMMGFFKRGMGELASGHVSPCMHILSGSLASAKDGKATWQKFWSIYRNHMMAARFHDGSFSARPTKETQQLHSNTDRGEGPAWTTAHYTLVMQAEGSKLKIWGK